MRCLGIRAKLLNRTTLEHVDDFVLKQSDQRLAWPSASRSIGSCWEGPTYIPGTAAVGRSIGTWKRKTNIPFDVHLDGRSRSRIASLGKMLPNAGH